jgi:outer membrane protein OmpA-like peptidoglycan-associated protein
MSRLIQPLTLAIVAAALATSACTTNPQTGESQLSKTALYGLGGAVACGAIGAMTGSGHAARDAALACGALGAAAGGYMDYQEKNLREKLANTQIGVQRLGDQLKLTLPENVTFAVDHAELKGNAKGSLNSIGDIMVQYPNTKITVQGFTDSTGSASHNQSLSERRAESVTTQLAARGVDSTRIRTMGFGASRPIASNATVAGRAKNRRVEILIDPVQ